MKVMNPTHSLLAHSSPDVYPAQLNERRHSWASGKKQEPPQRDVSIISYQAGLEIFSQPTKWIWKEYLLPLSAASPPSCWEPRGPAAVCPLSSWSWNLPRGPTGRTPTPGWTNGRQCAGASHRTHCNSHQHLQGAEPSKCSSLTKVVWWPLII